MTAPPPSDAVVVGGGPAGLAATTWLARYRARVLLLDAGEHRNRWVEEAHGYLGDDPLAPMDLVARARRQLAAYPEAEVQDGGARSARAVCDGGPFALDVDGTEVLGRHLVFATGVEDVFPEVGGFFEHYGASVFHCPTCDGYEAKGCAVVAFGWSAELTGFALTLLGWARSVTVVTDGRRFEGDDAQRAELARAGIAVLEDDAVELVGRRGALEAVQLRHLGRRECQLAFFSIAHHPRTALARQLGCALTADGCVEVDHEGATSVPGVYAAGDLTPGLQLVQVAAAKGTIAGVACAQSLRGTRSGMTDENPTTPADADPLDGGRLDDLQRDIDEVRDRVDDPLDQGDQMFIDEGTRDTELADDAIVPPG